MGFQLLGEMGVVYNILDESHSNQKGCINMKLFSWGWLEKN